ncbi:terminase [Saccharothrix saharensis]|uniref:terminase n=1 Tax=Saccharothrix saharensis TaxID=571190 RepID=UPI0036A47FBE
MTVVEARPTSFGLEGLLGSTHPRLETPPLVTGPPGPCGCGCALTEETSYGFDVCWFAEHVLKTPLDPWERRAVIHGGELLPDGRPRFRKLLIVVARQQGKTFLVMVLILFWQFIERWPMILATSTNLAYAKEVWQNAVNIAESTPDLACDIPKGGVRKAAGEECLTAVDPEDPTKTSRYKIAASNRKGGRSLSIDRLALDELREHPDWSAWGAAYNAMSARPFGQVVAITNQGDDASVVLDSLREEALRFIETGKGDHRLGLLEWSAPEGSDPEDPHALAMANPNIGRRTDIEDLLADARRAKANGGEELNTFLTEILCVRVKHMNPAVNPEKWAANLDPGDLAGLRNVALVVDVSMDTRHASLVAAAVLPSDDPDVLRVRVEVIAAWEGEKCLSDLRRELPGHVKKIKPRVLGWMPNGPAAAVAAKLTTRKGARAPWLPAGVQVVEIREELPAVVMGFVDVIDSGEIAHSGDPLLDAHVLGAEKLMRGDAYVFTRKGAGHVDCAYAAAGAVHLARTLPASVGKPRLVVARQED